MIYSLLSLLLLPQPFYHVNFFTKFIAAATSLLLLHLYIIPHLRRARSHRTPLPPSPPKLPFIGNLHQLGPLPHRSLHAFSDRYGPLMLLQLGSARLLVASSPEMAREVMKTQDHVFANRPSLSVAHQVLYQGRDIAFAPYGKYWRQLKKVSILHLLSGRRVRSYRTVREEEVALMVHRISRSASDGPLDVSEALKSLAKGVISRAAFGKSSREEWWDGDIHKVIEQNSSLMGEFHFGDYFPSLAWVSAVTGLDSRARDAFAMGEKIVDEVIEHHLARSRDDGPHEYVEDFVDVLLSVEREQSMELQFNRENIKAIITDMFGAGTDSTYITMEWAMSELVRNPEVMRKLREEIRKIAGSSRKMIREEDLIEMSYLRAVMKESLRLHPTGPFLVPRESMEETRIQEYRIPSGTRVVINVWAIGRDPKVWEDPQEFRPERFIGSPVDFMGHDFELTPFGAGRRVCPGIQFAVPVMELALANLVHWFEWEPPIGTRAEDLDMGETFGLTMRRKNPLRLVATPCW